MTEAARETSQRAWQSGRVAEAEAEAVTARKQREATTGEERTVDVL